MSNEARDKAADAFVTECPKYSGYPAHIETFKAGWDGRDTEVAVLSECLKDRENDWKRIQDAERERDALKKALDLALYYIEGDATFESVKERIKAMGIDISEAGKVK